MTYREKMLHHLGEAEKRNAEVETWENWAEQRVQEKYADKLAKVRPGEARRNVELFYIEEELKKHRVYHNHVSVRNYHLMMARTYGLASIVEGEQPPTQGQHTPFPLSPFNTP